MTHINSVLINLFRVGFVGVLVLEIFRWKVLHSSVTFSWLGLILTAAIFFALLEIALWLLEKKLNLHLPWVAYAAAFLMLSLDAFGDMFGFYATYAPWFDRFMHLFGGFMGGVIVYSIFRMLHMADRGRFSARWMVVLVIFITFFFGFAYEWLEYAEDIFYWKEQVRLGDAYDTIDDMQLNLLGILSSTFLLYKLMPPRKHDE